MEKKQIHLKLQDRDCQLHQLQQQFLLHLKMIISCVKDVQLVHLFLFHFYF